MAGERLIGKSAIAGLAFILGAGCGSAVVGGHSGSSGPSPTSSNASAAPGTAASDAGQASAAGPADAGVVDDGLASEIAALAERSAGQVYLALLRPLNPRVNGRPVRGIAAVTVDGDSVDVVVLAKGLAPGQEHMQHIHGVVETQATGPAPYAACPPSSADVNKDGLVDVVEGVPFYGPILVPLDSDLNDPNPNAFPTASAEGVVRYENRGSLSAIERSIGEALDPERRVIALHGVANNTALPPTTQTLPGLAPVFTLPVACGELVRVK